MESSDRPSSGDPWSRTIPVRVDMAGIIRIMGQALYSRPSTPIRELIQNAHDGITRRRARDLSFEGAIRVRRDPEAGTISFTDDGVGLDEADAERYLGTLGSSLTSLLKGEGQARQKSHLIGQFGIGLFSVFLLAKRIVLESRKDEQPAIRWEAEGEAEVLLAGSDRTDHGTTVTLWLRDENLGWARDENLLREAILEYADFLSVPIFLDDEETRCNRVQASWLEPTVERSFLEIELEELFGEAPLDLVAVHGSDPIAHRGVLYVSPERTPGFTSEATLTVTIGRMVISRSIRELLPRWAGCFRGIVEASCCSPTASREDLVRDPAFMGLRAALEEQLFEHLEGLASNDPDRLQSILSWHRYAFAGAALRNPRLRRLLRGAYRWKTSAGPLNFDEIVRRSPADPIQELEHDHVLWFQAHAHQERWATRLFGGLDTVCVHALRSFEETLLAMLVADARAEGASIDLRPVSMEADHFASAVLGVHETEELDPAWQEFLGIAGALVVTGRVGGDEPALAFLNETHDLQRTFAELKRAGELPPGFQRLIDQHFDGAEEARHQVLLNTRHELVRRCLDESPAHPLASVLRLQVAMALETAGARLGDAARGQKSHDLSWIAETLWPRGGSAS